MHANVHYPEWSNELRNLYWHLRDVRLYDLARRRKYYRYIRKERDCLLQKGINHELLRLFCRHLSNPTCRFAASRLAAFERQMHMQRFQIAYGDLLPSLQKQREKIYA